MCELGHAPARANELQNHPANLINVYGLADPLRHRLSNVAREDRMRVRLRAEQIFGRELRDRRVAPHAIEVDALYVEDTRARRLSIDAVVPDRLATNV